MPLPIPLIPHRILPGQQEFREILAWPFPTDRFYEAQVTRLLELDIPQRVENSFGLVWLYRDPVGNAVGFSTLDVCRDYKQFTNGQNHSHIPLLAVHPLFQKRGHGRAIIEHLIGEAVLIARSPHDISDFLFLDVYSANVGAIALYKKCGFTALNAELPIPDPNENHETYIVMAKRIGLGTI